MDYDGDSRMLTKYNWKERSDADNPKYRIQN